MSFSLKLKTLPQATSLYEVCDPSQDPDTWFSVYALDAEHAAEVYCEKYDSFCDYCYSEQGTELILVRSQADEKTWQFEVAIQIDISFEVTEVDGD